MEDSIKKEILEWVKAIAIALVVVFVIKYFVFDIMAIDGISMEPTLSHRDRVFVNIAGYKLGKPKRLDVIIFKPSIQPDVYYVKRVIGIPGDTVEIRNGKVYVNGEELSEDYLAPNTNTYPDIQKMIVPEDKVFVLGDNRPNSEDSRDKRLGAIPIKSIKGRVEFRIFPLNTIKKI